MSLPNDTARCPGHHWKNKPFSECINCARREQFRESDLPRWYIEAPKYFGSKCPERIDNESR